MIIILYRNDKTYIQFHRFCFYYSPIEIEFHLGNPLNKDLHWKIIQTNKVILQFWLKKCYYKQHLWNWNKCLLSFKEKFPKAWKCALFDYKQYTYKYNKNVQGIIRNFLIGVT